MATEVVEKIPPGVAALTRATLDHARETKPINKEQEK
jgi:hypothetical protein